MARPYMVTSDEKSVTVDSWSEAELHVDLLRSHGHTGVEIHTR